MTIPSRDDWLTLTQAADALATSDESIRRAIAAGRMRALKDGRRVRIHKDWLAEYIERQSNGPVQLVARHRRAS